MITFPTVTIYKVKVISVIEEIEEATTTDPNIYRLRDVLVVVHLVAVSTAWPRYRCQQNGHVFYSIVLSIVAIEMETTDIDRIAKNKDVVLDYMIIENFSVTTTAISDLVFVTYFVYLTYVDISTLDEHGETTKEQTNQDIFSVSKGSISILIRS